MSRRVAKLDFARTHSWKYAMWGTIQKPQTSTIQYWAGSLREKAGYKENDWNTQKHKRGPIDRTAISHLMMRCVVMTTDCMRMVFCGVLEPWNQ